MNTRTMQTDSPAPSPAPVPTKEQPFLRRGATVTHGDGQVVIRHVDREVLLEGAGAALFARAERLLDGKTSVESIAARLEERPGRVRALVEQLEGAGVVSFLVGPEQDTLMSGVEFHRLHRELCNHWLQPVYAHPFWENVTSGRATRAQVLGFAFEKYHYIEAAFEHMGIAAANSSPEMMPHLARHFIEEYTHGDIYRKGLRSLFPDDFILRSQPLPSTRALVNYLTECAQHGSFSYYSGNELLQMTENEDGGASGAVNAFYEAMRQHYPYTGRIIDSFVAHTRADQHLGHSNAFLEMCQSVPPLTRREVNESLNVARNMAEHLLLFMDGIDTFYGNFATVPRLPCDLLSE
jgi:pyrroloquinoline quinone (PQQ) biosynthesis protein C